MQKPKVSKFLLVFLIVLILAIAVVYFFRLIKIKQAPVSGILYEKSSSAGECDGYCNWHLTLYVNGRLDLEKEKNGSNPDKKVKTVILSEQKTDEIKQTIRNSGILTKNCNQYGLMDYSATYTIKLDENINSFETGFVPAKMRIITDNCTTGISDIENVIGYQGW